MGKEKPSARSFTLNPDGVPKRTAQPAFDAPETEEFRGYSRSQKGLGFRVWNMALGGLVLGSLILYLKGMRIMMFQLSGFYCSPKA